jgi:DNA-binding NarL/FixJ family response regulator
VIPRATVMMADPSTFSSNGEIGVLICDDVDAMRWLLGVVIELRAGLCVVGEARDGSEAVAEAARLQLDVILLDLSMPNRTGLDALPEIKQVAPAARVIVLSGFAASTIEAEVLALGADRFIEKGADPDVIAATIEEVAAQRLPVAVLAAH